MCICVCTYMCACIYMCVCVYTYTLHIWKLFTENDIRFPGKWLDWQMIWEEVKRNKLESYLYSPELVKRWMEHASWSENWSDHCGDQLSMRKLFQKSGLSKASGVEWGSWPVFHILVYRVMLLRTKLKERGRMLWKVYAKFKSDQTEYFPSLQRSMYTCGNTTF